MTSRLLESYDPDELDAETEFYIQWVGGTMIAGGTATVSADVDIVDEADN